MIRLTELKLPLEYPPEELQATVLKTLEIEAPEDSHEHPLVGDIRLEIINGIRMTESVSRAPLRQTAS